MRILKRSLLGLGVLLVVAQVVRPARTNPAIDESRTIHANTRMTPEVAAILARSCKDCHSYKTEWPWYTNVAPASWFVIDHVNEGRKNLSLSDWANYDAKRASRKLAEMCEQVEQGEMPINSYLLLHPTARLSDSDKKTLCDWAKGESQRLAPNQSTDQGRN